MPFENLVGKGENAGKQHFLLFPQSFLHFHRHICIIVSSEFDISSANTLKLEQTENFIVW